MRCSNLVAEIDRFRVCFVLDAIQFSDVVIANHFCRWERCEFCVQFRIAKNLKLSLC